MPGLVRDGPWTVCSLSLFSTSLCSNWHVYRKGQFPEAFTAKYQILKDIRDKLEKLSLTQAWSLRETDLYDYQRQLEKIDESRIDHNFVDAEGNFAELYVQRVCSLSFHSIYKLTISRHCFTSFEEAMVTSTTWWFRPNLYRKHCSPYITNSKHWDAVSLKSKTQEELVRQGICIRIAWRYVRCLWEIAAWILIVVA